MAVVYAKRKQLLERIYHPRWIIQGYVYRLEHHPIFWQYIPYYTGFTFFFNYIYIMYFQITEQIWYRTVRSNINSVDNFRKYINWYFISSRVHKYTKSWCIHIVKILNVFFVWIEKEDNLDVVLSSKHLLLIFIYLLWPRYKT